MKKILTILTLLLSLTSKSQILTLDNLLYMYNKKFSVVNDYILNKKFDFIKSEDSYFSKSITYAKGYYIDYMNDAKASEWLNIENSYGNISSISYQHSSKADFNAFKASLIAKGYKVVSSDVKDDAIINEYSNKKLDISVSVNSNSDGKNLYLFIIRESLTSRLRADSIRSADSTAKVNAELKVMLLHDEAEDITIEKDTVEHNYYYNTNFNSIEVFSDGNRYSTYPGDYYFKKAMRGDIKVIKFYIVNNSYENIELKSSKSIDKCVMVKFDKKIVKLQEQALITITLNTKYAKVNSTKLYANEINIDSSIGEIPFLIYGYIK
jgi:hypothetical protein